MIPEMDDMTLYMLCVRGNKGLGFIMYSKLAGVGTIAVY